jgi:hypothetical protein
VGSSTPGKPVVSVSLMELAGPSRPLVVFVEGEPSSSRFHRFDPVAARWSSLLPSCSSPVTRLNFRAFPNRPVHTIGGDHMTQPPTPSLLLQSVTPPKPDDRSLPPLMGFARLSTDLLFLRPLPQRPRSLLRQPATKPTTRSALVVSHHFDGFLRKTAVSLLRLTASPRFATFHRWSSPIDPRASRGAFSIASPQRVFTPLEGFSSSAAAPCHHGRCLLGLALPRRALCLDTRPVSELRSQHTHRGQAGLQGFAPLTSLYRYQAVSSLYSGLSFHGLCSPSRSHTLRSRSVSREDQQSFRPCDLESLSPPASWLIE